LRQRHPAGNGADGGAFKPLYFRAEVSRNAQIQPEMTPMPARSTLGDQTSRSAVEDTSPTPKAARSADRTHVARVLDAFEEHGLGVRFRFDVGNLDLGGDA